MSGNGRPSALFHSRVCGIGDEAAAGGLAQVAVHESLGLRGLELRTVDGRGVHELAERDGRTLAAAVRDAGMTVPVVDTPVGNWATTVATDLSAEVEVLTRSALAAAWFGCRRLRVMSYPNDGRDERAWRAEAIRRMRVLTAVAQDLGVVLLHENCHGWASQSAAHSLELVAEVDSPALRLLFDVGNGVAHGYQPLAFLHAVLPLVEHVHVKDGVAGPTGEAVFGMPGQGSARLADCIALLERHGYHGWYSVEPHVTLIPHLDVRADPALQEPAYRTYVQTFLTLLTTLPAGRSPNRDKPAYRASGAAENRDKPAYRASGVPETRDKPAYRAVPAGDGGRGAGVRASVATRAGVRLSEGDVRWLVEFLSRPSVSPLEDPDADPYDTVEAQRFFLHGAAIRGFVPRRWDSPPAGDLDRAGVPLSVREAAGEDPAGFLTTQPSVVVGLGDPQPPHRRLVINFHVDTVGPHLPPRLDGRTLRGRGAVDDKGPGFAAMVGAAAAFAARPELAELIEVLLASVPGEEGGAMGSYGTRWLVESGTVGRLMIFAEPTGCRVLDACSAAMTPLFSVHGQDCTDDHPYDGHNSTLALGFLATRLADELGPLASRLGAKFCLAGVHTGDAHNRVYGAGELRCNLAYYDARTARRLERAVERVADSARAELVSRYAGNPVAARLAADWEHVVRLRWLKRGLPPLANRDPAMEALLAGVGLARHDGVADGTAFTCDAIWAGGPDRYVAVCGPGSLDRNGAHTPYEFVELDELDRYATHIRDLVFAFADHQRATDATYVADVADGGARP